MNRMNCLPRDQTLMIALVLSALATSYGNQAGSNDSFDTAIPIVYPFDVSGTLSSTADRVFYDLVPPGLGALVLRWTGGDSCMKAAVYDHWGRWVGYVDQAANQCEIYVLVPARYYLEVFSADGVTKGSYRIHSTWRPFGPERDGGRVYLSFDIPAHEFVARDLIPVVAGRIEAELTPYGCSVVTSEQLSGQEATGEWVGVQVGPGPSVGGGTWGSRRPSGGCAAGWSGEGAEQWLWQSLFGWPGVVSHETGHGFGIPHVGYGAAAGIQLDYGWTLIIHSYWNKVWSLREYMTIACQAGYFGVEIEPNNDLSVATDVHPWLEQMRKDDLQTNDAFVATGKISDGSDVDVYSLMIGAGEKWRFDIDAAEFLHPLDACLEIVRANGEVLAQSDDATDPDSGVFSADPFIEIRLSLTERVHLRVSGRNGGVGGYHLIGKPEACFDKTGPRIYGVLPDGRSQAESTNQVFVYFNEEIDRQTLTPSGVRLTGETTGPVPGKITFDPLRCLMRFDADVPLTPDVYTLTLTGLTDYSGNLLDGETNGAFEYPQVSGNGVPGGEFTCVFTVVSAHSAPAPFWLLDATQDRGNGTWLILQSSDPISTASITPANLMIRNDGSDGRFDTPDDHLFPLLCWNYDVLVEHPTIKTETWVWMMATLPPDSYRCDYDLIDAAGHPVRGRIPFGFTSWPAGQGPRIVRVSPNPDIPHGEPVAQIEVQFSGAMSPATITPETFRVLYSSTGTFFHGSDVLIVDADGVVEYDPVKYLATFKPASPLGPGFYRIELSGRRGGITDIDGHLLDGEYLAAGIYKCDGLGVRAASPSGNMAEGGDYTAVITIETPATP